MALNGTHNISKSLRTFLHRLQNIQNPYTGYNTHDIPSQKTEYADYKTCGHSITEETGLPTRIKKPTPIPSQNTKYTKHLHGLQNIRVFRHRIQNVQEYLHGVQQPRAFRH